MTITGAHYANADHSQIAVTADGVVRFVPVAQDNAHYVTLIASGRPIGPYVSPRPTADDVRAECRRRMMALLEARDGAHLDVLIANGTREAVRLLRKGEADWTAEEAARAAQLAAIDQAIEALRAASNAIEADPPGDFAADGYWPGGRM